MPTSSQFKIVDTLEKKRRAQALWHLARHAGVYSSDIERAGHNSAKCPAYHTELTPKCPTDSVFSSSAVEVSKGARFKRHASCFHLGVRVNVKYDDSENSGDCPDIVHSHLFHSGSTSVETTFGYSQGPHSFSGEDRPQSEGNNNVSEELKNQLYSLGFREVPGEKTRENLNFVFKRRRGIKKKVDTINVKEKAEEPVFIEGITTEPVQGIDISSIDQSILKPTALCFDANGLNISHNELKAALDRTLQHSDGVEIRTIQFENRRLKEGNLPNRWMIYTDSQDSRNIVSGRQLAFGERYVALRRYDDLVLLDHKKALRAEAWKNVLGIK